MMSEEQKELAKIIENYFGADAGYLDIDCFTLARRIIEAGWIKPIRCKDCRWYEANCETCVLHSDDGDTYDFGNEVDMKPDDFCSYGERREGE